MSIKLTEPDQAAPHNEPEEPRADDPFFGDATSAEWNACIGPQGLEVNYVEGYVSAACCLVETLLEKRDYGGRDTLAMPILYNARHGIELALKFAVGNLAELGRIKSLPRTNHDIGACWSHLVEEPVGDEALRSHVADLKPFVDSLAAIDADGQGLRYFHDRDGHRSLPDRSLINLLVVRHSIVRLQELIERLVGRTIDLCEEVRTGTTTAELSSSDLRTITDLLPPRVEWESNAFDEAKAVICRRYRLSGKKFSRALDAIQGDRGLAGRLGVTSELAHLTTSDVDRVVKAWTAYHAVGLRRRERGAGVAVVNAAELMDEMRRTDLSGRTEVLEGLAAALGQDGIADLRAVFYLGREGSPAPCYERDLSSQKSGVGTSGRNRALADMLEKTNLLRCLKDGLAALGANHLAARVPKETPLTG